MDNFELWYRANRAKFASGASPLTFQSTGKPINNWTIYGHTSLNLFDISAVSADSGIDRDTGEIVESSGSLVSDWTAYDSEKSLFISAQRTIAAATSVIFAFYDSEKNYIDWVGVVFSSGRHSYEITEIPDSAAFFRVQFFDDGFSNVMINQGDSALPYEPFGAVGERTENIFPLPSNDSVKTVSQNGITLTVNEYGRAFLSGTATSTVDFKIYLKETFTFPLSVAQGGGGTLAFNNSNILTANQIRLYIGSDFWAFTTKNRTNNSYVALGGETINFYTVRIYKGVQIPTGMTFAFAVSNNGIYVTPYEPYGYKIPITCGGETTNIYIGDTPLETGQTVTGSDTGVAIPTVDGENTLSIGTTVQPSKVVISAASGMTESVKRYFDYKYGVLKMAGIKE